MGANISVFNGVVLPVIGDVPVDSEASMMTSLISRILPTSKMLIGVVFPCVLHRGECACGCECFSCTV